jgi:hypothetical protein
VVAAETAGERALASEMQSLAAQVVALRTQVGGLATMANQVAALADRVAELAAVGSEGSGAVGPTSWFDADPERAATDLVYLAGWVYEVLSQYRTVAQQLTDCWRRHPAAVEGLLALRAAWFAAYRRPGARPGAAVDWHIRLLPGVVDLLREELRACSESNHAPGGDVERYRRTHPRLVPDDDQLRGYASWWAADRGQAPEPDLS